MSPCFKESIGSHSYISFRSRSALTFVGKAGATGETVQVASKHNVEVRVSPHQHLVRTLEKAERTEMAQLHQLPGRGQERSQQPPNGTPDPVLELGCVGAYGTGEE